MTTQPTPTPTPTPLTDAVAHGPSAGSFFTMMDHARVLETELAALRAEIATCKDASESLIAVLRAENARLEKQIADDNRSYGCELLDPCGTIWEQAALDRARAERAEAKIIRLRADLERFTGDGLLDCHAICDQRDAAVAERDALRNQNARLTKQIADDNRNYALDHACAERAEAAPSLPRYRRVAITVLPEAEVKP